MMGGVRGLCRTSGLLPRRPGGCPGLESRWGIVTTCSGQASSLSLSPTQTLSPPPPLTIPACCCLLAGSLTPDFPAMAYSLSPKSQIEAILSSCGGFLSPSKLEADYGKRPAGFTCGPQCQHQAGHREVSAYAGQPWKTMTESQTRPT